jgi:hypothetical protein
MVMNAPKPFHVSIVEVIRQAREAYELSILANLINQTEISRNYDAIIEAWDAKVAELGHKVLFGIAESVMAQKPDRSYMSLEELRMAEAEDVANEFLDMSDDDVAGYLKEHGLEDLVSPDRVDALLEKAMETVRQDPRKAARLLLIWDRDKDKPKSED